MSDKRETVVVDNKREMRRWLEDSVRSRANLRSVEAKLAKSVLWELASERKSAKTEVYVMTPIIYKDHLITMFAIWTKYGRISQQRFQACILDGVKRFVMG